MLTTSNAAADGYCMDSEEQAFLQLINDYRAQNGVGPLVAVQTAGAAADYHSTDMAMNNYFSHTLYDGTSWSQNMINFGYTQDGGYKGENIAGGYSTASAVFAGWKASSAHNTNMLTTSYKAIGIGRAYGANSTYKWYWTTDFGGYVDGAATICGSSTPTPAPTSTMISTPTNTPSPMPTATNTPSPLPTATKTPTVQPTQTPAPAPTSTSAPVVAVYVAAMSGKASTKGKTTTISVTVTINDTNGRAVNNAVVTTVLSAPDGTSQVLTGTTNGRGQAMLSVKTSRGPGVYHSNVTNVSASGRTYDPSWNAASSVAITVP
jgi:Cysteine-rich secretory protein family